MCLYSSKVNSPISTDEYVILKDIYKAIDKDDTPTMKTLTQQLLELQQEADKIEILNHILNNLN